VAVRIYEDARAMRRAIRRETGYENPKGGAFTITDGEGVAHVFFAASMLLLDFVAHEASHVAMDAVARKFGKRSLFDRQEEVATISGEFVRLFWNKYLGLDDDFHVLGTARLFEQNFTKELV